MGPLSNTNVISARVISYNSLNEMNDKLSGMTVLHKAPPISLWVFSCTEETRGGEGKESKG